MNWRLAIDFGTSNTAAAIDVNGAVRPIGLSDGGISMPSAVVLTPTGFRVGEEAINAQLRHPDGFERTPKALIGRGDVVLGGKIVSPEDLITETYSFVRDAALRRQNGQPPREVWLTHPVAWAPSQIESLRKGAIAAGFDPETIHTVSEPIAAAAHYARNQQAAPGSRVAVFDFGGGTLDLAVLERAPQSPVGYKVLAYGGDPVLGGRTFDARLLDWTLDTLKARGYGELASRLHQPKTMAELRAQSSLNRAVTAAKTELSTRPDADISVSLGDDDAVVTITRAEYERLIAADIERAGKLLADVFERVSGPRPEVLYLTGGSSRTPAISQMIRERTNLRIATLDDPKLVTAEGALYVGAAANGGRAPQRGGQARPGAGFPMGPGGPQQAMGHPRPGQQRPGGPGPGSQRSGQHAPVPHRPGPQRPGQQGPGPQRPGQQGPGPQRPGQQGPGPQRPGQQGPGQHTAPHNLGQHGPAPQTRSAGGSNGPGRPGYDASGSQNRGAATRQQPFATNSQYNAPPETPEKKKSKVGLIITLVVVAALVIGGGIWGGIMLFGNQGGGEAGGETTPPAVDVPSGSIECWDGATVGATENCTALSGEEALRWIVKVDGTSCSTADFESQAALECKWYDKSNVHLYLLEFNDAATAAAYGSESYGGAEGSDWQLNGEHAGTSWEGTFEQASGGYSYYYVYDGLPYGIFVRFDNDSNGNHGVIEDVQSRFHPKPYKDVAVAVAVADRV